MKKYIKNILLIIGVCLMAAAIGYKVINYIEVNKSEDKLDVKLEQGTQSKSFDYDSLALGDEIGKLVIPSLNIEGIIVEGIDEENIKHNIGHFPQSAMAGQEGNFSIAGHRGTLENNVFNNLYKIKAQDEIIIEALDGTYVYQVTEQFVVAPHETAVLNTTPGKHEITIVTCTLDGKERLIVKGILLEEEEK